jgi:pyruvate kinase
MLNKGPHLVEALTALNSILRRMQAHQVKKRPTLRRLNIASSSFKTAAAA